MRAIIAVAALLGVGIISAVHAQTTPLGSEAAARACIHRRLAELIAQDQRQNIANDAALNTCSKGVEAELKRKKKTGCEIKDYVGWLVANENSKLNGLSGQPYKPNSTFVQRCEKATPRMK